MKQYHQIFTHIGKWQRYYEEIRDVESLKIPRHVICNLPAHIEYHGFCDASEMGYILLFYGNGAALHVRSIDRNGTYHSHLLYAKSRVAPLEARTMILRS